MTSGIVINVIPRQSCLLVMLLCIKLLINVHLSVVVHTFHVIVP